VPPAEPQVRSLPSKRFEDFEPAPRASRHRVGTQIISKKFEDFEPAPPAPPARPSPETPVPTPLPDLCGKRLGEILVATGRLSPEQAQVSLQAARLAHEALGRYLVVRRKLISPLELCQALSLQSNLPVVHFTDTYVPVAAKYARLLDAMQRLELVPFSETDQAVCVAAKRPLLPQRIAEAEQLFRKKVSVCLAPDDQITAILNALGAAQPTQKRRSVRYKITMPVWLQLPHRRVEDPGLPYGGQILNVSLGGLKVRAPDALIAERKAHGDQPQVLVRFSAPPLEVHGLCSVRYVVRKENAAYWEDPWIMGLEFATLGPIAREHFRVLYERAKIASRRLEVEFGEGSEE